MKFTAEIAVSILLFAASCTAGPIDTRAIEAAGKKKYDCSQVCNNFSTRDVSAAGKKKCKCPEPDQSQDQVEPRDVNAEGKKKKKYKCPAPETDQGQDQVEPRDVNAEGKKKKKKYKCPAPEDDQGQDQVEPRDVSAAGKNRYESPYEHGHAQARDVSAAGKDRYESPYEHGHAQARDVKASHWHHRHHDHYYGDYDDYLGHIAPHLDLVGVIGRDVESAGKNSYSHDHIQARHSAATEKSAKDQAIERAKERHANQTRIDFLNSVPAESFEKMRTTRRKLHQAFDKLWKGDVPEMAKLPEAGHQHDGKTPAKNNTEPRPTTTKGWYIHWASHHNLPADKLKILNDTKPSEFDALKGKNTKEKLIAEGKMLKMDDKVKFFEDKVPAAVYAELDKLKETARNFRQSIKKMEKPKL
ncbi:hypothetical protein TWF694_000639 [Orbilia ellipsospora]|uniref:Uncharacterized protein n=1 Tax=Orbilia ellipsospora TaxID=2528407 RepID=A0AAV9XQZ3_9PEZI